MDEGYAPGSPTARDVTGAVGLGGQDCGASQHAEANQHQYGLYRRTDAEVGEFRGPGMARHHHVDDDEEQDAGPRNDNRCRQPGDGARMKSQRLHARCPGPRRLRLWHGRHSTPRADRGDRTAPPGAWREGAWRDHGRRAARARPGNSGLHRFYAHRILAMEGRSSEPAAKLPVKTDGRTVAGTR